MVTVREFLDLVNCTIRFTTYEGEYEGVVRLVCPINQRLNVERIFFLPDRIYMGTLRFFCNEIYEFKVLSRSDAVDPEQDLHAIARKYESRKVDALALFDEYDDSDVISLGTAGEPEFPEEEYVLKLPPKFGNLPLDVVTLDSIGEEFLQAVNHIKSAASIGISLEGPKLGRHGIISWLCVSTSSCTFLFDIQELGAKVFENGLREILEDSSVEKVVHDCREVSDCLYHMFKTRLVNVFDTQVADKLVTMQKSRDGKFNKHVDSLNSCLRNYLAVPEEFLYRNKLSEAYHQLVISFQLRPPPCVLQDIMVKNVIYLQLLKKKLELEMLNPFKRAVEVYLQVLQCASDQELLLDPSVSDQIPSELMLEGIQIVRFKDHLVMPSVVASGPPYRKTKNPIKQYLEHCKKHGNINDNTNTSPDTDLQSVEKSVPVITPDTNMQSVEKCVPVVTPDTNLKSVGNCVPVVTPDTNLQSVEKSVLVVTPDTNLQSVENSVPVANNIPSEVPKVYNVRKESQKDFKPSECVANVSADTKVTAVISDSKISDISVSSRLNVNKNIENRVNYSRRELDQMYFTECSKVSLDDEKNWQENNRNEYSSQVDELDDPWASFRKEFSKLRGPIGDDPEMKRRFVPAGKA